MGWQPFLQGERQRAALGRVREICESLREPPENLSPDLPGGSAGLAVLFAYAAGADIGVPDAEELALQYLDKALEDSAESDLTASLHGGFPGVAWTLDHLRTRLPELADDDDPCLDIDEEIASVVDRRGEPIRFDLVSGLCGLAVYALERKNASLANAIAGKLVGLAEQTEEGATWQTAPGLLPPDQKEQFPTGHYNLGAAHGVPAVIAVLAAMESLGVSDLAGVRADAVRWLLAHRQPADVGSTFTWAFAAGDRPSPSRLAWCYGDPGVGACLLTAALSCGDTELLEAAFAVLRGAASRSIASSGIADGGICHGSAGLAAIFLRALAVRDDPVISASTSVWFDHLLGEHDSAYRFGGYASAVVTGTSVRRLDDPGLLCGSAGIALTLLAAATECEPSWDRAFLLSGWPRP